MTFETMTHWDIWLDFRHDPHRGFETITYMLKGKMRHRDSNGNAGLLKMAQCNG